MEENQGTLANSLRLPDTRTEPSMIIWHLAPANPPANCSPVSDPKQDQQKYHSA